MRQWHAIGLFGDDLRQELGNRASLMGVYPDNANIAGGSVVLPRLAIYVRIHIAPDADLGPISVKIRFPNGEEDVLGEYDVNSIKQTQGLVRDKGGPWVGLIVSAIALQVRAEEGRILLVAKVGDDEVVCGSLNLQVVEQQTTLVATASEQPALQSPS